jgi:hypothetical protein
MLKIKMGLRQADHFKMGNLRLAASLPSSSWKASGGLRFQEGTTGERKHTFAFVPKNNRRGTA